MTRDYTYLGDITDTLNDDIIAAISLDSKIYSQQVGKIIQYETSVKEYRLINGSKVLRSEVDMLKALVMRLYLTELYLSYCTYIWMYGWPYTPIDGQP